MLVLFQSAPSVKRATQDRKDALHHHLVSIRALREEGDANLEPDQLPPAVSIRALREEGDDDHVRRDPKGNVSIRALREEGDRFPLLAVLGAFVSIRALREEGDCHTPISGELPMGFNPRPP